MFAKVIVILLVAQVISAQNANSTQTAIFHGNRLYCTPTKWYDVGIFLLGNYVSHALTIKAYPGEATTSVLIASVGALLIPTTGLIRGINAIARNAKFTRKNFWHGLFHDPDYQTAAAAGALCMVVRKKSWKPCPGDKLSNVVLRDEVKAKEYNKWRRSNREWRKSFHLPIWHEVEPIARESDESKPVPEPVRTLKVYRGPWTEERGRFWMHTDTREEFVHPSRTVHVSYDFKDQAWSYALAHVPRDAVMIANHLDDITPRLLESKGTGISQKSSVMKSRSVKSLPEVHKPKTVIAASYSIPRVIIAMFQLIYAIVTVYQSRGNQIEHYGYAAFALTVIPYAIMSLINLLGHMLTPDYHALYLVASDVMDEAIKRGCRFDGVVGRLEQDMDDRSAVCEVFDGGERNSGTEFLYSDATISKTFPISVVDYTSQSLAKSRSGNYLKNMAEAILAKAARRRYVNKKVDEVAEDLSASVFIPSCSEFRRLNSYTYPTDKNRSQMTPQGSFGFSSQKSTVDWRVLVCILDAGVIMGIIGGITGFRSGQASNSQLNWILHWYNLGACFSGFEIFDGIQNRAWPEPDMGPPPKYDVWLMLLPCVLYGVPAIGGYIVVINMLYDWGSCILI